MSNSILESVSHAKSVGFHMEMTHFEKGGESIGGEKEEGFE